jgi:hypothetical protein
MSGRITEREAKIELVTAVARSQMAIARMLESMADLSGLSPFEARAIAENIRLLTNLQQSLTESVAGTRLCERRTGLPGRPWLAAELRMPRPSMHAAARTGRENQ